MEHTDDLRGVPVILAFSGWNDAGSAASDTALYLLENYPSHELTQIDDERYYDFQSTRPQLRRSADGPYLVWPRTVFHAVHHPQQDFVVALGPEPSLLWRSYGQELIDCLEVYEPSMVVLLGAMLTDTPHSRPLPVSVHSYDRSVQERLAVEPLTYEGPSGIVGVVNQMLSMQGIPTASLWVSVPHYVATPPNPKAQQALIRQLEHVLDLTVELEDLPVEAEKWTRAVDELSSEDPDVAEYIEQLEEAKDASDAEEATGDAIAAEFERYLKGRFKD